MHKKRKLDCTIYTVLRLRRGLTRGQEAGKGKEYVTSAINRAKAQHIPARRSNQGARARLDRESVPSKCKRETGRHERSFHLDNIRGLTGQKITKNLESGPADTLTATKFLDYSFTKNPITAKPIRRKPRRPQSGQNINFITKLHKITSKQLYQNE